MKYFNSLGFNAWYNKKLNTFLMEDARLYAEHNPDLLKRVQELSDKKGGKLDVIDKDDVELLEDIQKQLISYPGWEETVMKHLLVTEEDLRQFFVSNGEKE